MTDITEWSAVASGELTDEWILTTENGWGLLLAYCAGTANLRQEPITTEQRIAASKFPITEADVDSIDDDIAEYLTDAGAPAPPRGHLWYIRRPGTLTDDEFWAQIQTATEAEWPKDNHPSHLTPVFIRAMAELYSQ